MTARRPCAGSASAGSHDSPRRRAGGDAQASADVGAGREALRVLRDVRVDQLGVLRRASPAARAPAVIAPSPAALLEASSVEEDVNDLLAETMAETAVPSPPRPHPPSSGGGSREGATPRGAADADGSSHVDELADAGGAAERGAQPTARMRWVHRAGVEGAAEGVGEDALALEEHTLD